MPEKIKIKIKKIKKHRSILTALKWWDELPIQNLIDVSDSWAAYCMKYYPNGKDIYHLTKEEIHHIWKNEHLT